VSDTKMEPVTNGPEIEDIIIDSGNHGLSSLNRSGSRHVQTVPRNRDHINTWTQEYSYGLGNF
jgi:hypothetical protein